MAEEKVNITAVNLANHEDNNVSVFLTVETRGLAYLSRLLKKIEAVKGIISVARIGEELSSKKGMKSRT